MHVLLGGDLQQRRGRINLHLMQRGLLRGGHWHDGLRCVLCWILRALYREKRMLSLSHGLVHGRDGGVRLHLLRSREVHGIHGLGHMRCVLRGVLPGIHGRDFVHHLPRWPVPGLLGVHRLRGLSRGEIFFDPFLSF